MNQPAGFTGNIHHNITQSPPPSGYGLGPPPQAYHNRPPVRTKSPIVVAAPAGVDTSLFPLFRAVDQNGA